MKKMFYLFAVSAAMLLTACSSEEVTNGVTDTSQATPMAVGFDIYASSATRAGDAGIQTTATIQAAGKGFGVFAVQSDNTNYSATQTTDFMWNEHVTYNASAWTYSPLKYWPNETKDDSQTPHPAHSESSNIDRLSFFAYAPYVQGRTDNSGMLDGVSYSSAPTYAAHGAGAGQTGIVALNSNNDAVNSPYVWYVASPIPSKSVDLLWGVAPAGDLNYKSVNGTNINIGEGKPLIDLIKPSKDQKIKFLFKHALARLGVTIVAAVDQIAPGGNLDANTKIAVESIKIEDVTAGGQQLFTEGLLNLNNVTAGTSRWENKTGGSFSVIIDATHELSNAIKWLGSPAATLVSAFTGVNKEEKSAIKTMGMSSQADAYFMIIPSHASTDLKVTITYYVFTADSKVSGGYAVTKNVIDQVVTIPGLTNNKAYNLKLILGLTSVKLDAEVADWQVDGSTDVNLPRNNE